MPDREKVTYDIERCICRVPDACRDCSHYQDDRLDCMEKLLADALSLLKEQEAVQPRKEDDGNPQPWTAWWYVCGDCGREIEYHDRFCRWCGRAVKWDG